ncbi:hypothetical protein D3C80_2075180 [compost metagenome]
MNGVEVALAGWARKSASRTAWCGLREVRTCQGKIIAPVRRSPRLQLEQVILQCEADAGIDRSGHIV